MTTPLWCIVFAALMPYVLAGYGGFLRVKQLGSMDGHEPRRQALELQGSAARAYAAQQNSWEALAVFTAAVIVAHLAGADPGTSATVSLVFVGARILHAILYISDVATARSAAFMIGFGCCITLFVLAARAA